MGPQNRNIDTAEIKKFEALAAHWWDKKGALKALHHINPLRLNYISKRLPLKGKRVLDVGCGGGILSEALAAAGGIVTGIDAANAPLAVAEDHSRKSGLKIEYRCDTIEGFRRTTDNTFDVITCMELLEHVPDPSSIIAKCSQLLRPGGHLFCATLNRTVKAFLLAIIGAEYILGIVPRGTHQIGKFIKPAELTSWAEQYNLRCIDISGYKYNPFNGKAALSNSTAINYLAHFQHSA